MKITTLCRTGFDTTTGAALGPVEPPGDRPELDPAVARQSLARALHLTVYPRMPDGEIERIGQAIMKMLS